MGFKCKACGRLLYNRRRTTCEFCGAAILPDQLLSPKQQAAIDKLKAEEAKKHRQFMTQQLPGDTFGGPIL